MRAFPNSLYETNISLIAKLNIVPPSLLRKEGAEGEERKRRIEEGDEGEGGRRRKEGCGGQREGAKKITDQTVPLRNQRLLTNY